MDEQKTLEWLEAISARAMDEARAGNTTLVNRIGRVPAAQYYFNNVFALKTLTAEQYATQHPALMREADAMRTEYEAMEAAAGAGKRIGALEEELSALKEQLAAQAEALKTLTEAKPKAAKKKAQPVIEAEAETVEPDGDGQAEQMDEKPDDEPDNEPEEAGEGDAEEA